MTDLGQTTVTPNILLNATILQYFTQNFTYMQKDIVNAVSGPAKDSYEVLKDQTGALNAFAAVISTKYLCQVSRRKSTGTLFMSILVADLVFMQALWKILNLCSEAWLTHKDPKGKTRILPFSGDALKRLTLTILADHCSECAKQTSIALVSLDASKPEEEVRLSSEASTRRRDTRYSRPESPDETGELEDSHSLRLGI